MKFLVPNYSYLQNPLLGGYCPQIPVLFVLCSELYLLNPSPPRTKFLGTPLPLADEKPLWYEGLFCVCIVTCGCTCIAFGTREGWNTIVVCQLRDFCGWRAGG